MTASLPYAGTSGWSGSEASRQRAEDRDSSGKTGELQAAVENYIKYAGVAGHTIKEVRSRFPDHHHGSLSGTLTDLHKYGRLLRLTEQRERCSVYVVPQFLRDREFVPPKQQAKFQSVVIEQDMDAEYVGHLVIAALNKSDEARVRLLVRTGG